MCSAVFISLTLFDHGELLCKNKLLKKKIVYPREDETYIVGVLMNSFKCVPVFQIELEFGRVGF